MSYPNPFPGLQHWRYRTDPQGIGWLTLDYLHEPVNRLSPQVLSELSDIIRALHEQPPKGLVFTSGKETGFIAGADINAFSDLHNTVAIDALIDQGCSVFDRLQALSFPTVALVQGHCLGGGLELALACRHLLVVDDPRTALALPEVRIGIFPGWGGAKRLPQRIGPFKAIDLMLSGRSLNARQAVAWGLADAQVPPRLMLRAAEQLVLNSSSVSRGRGLAARVSEQRLIRPLFNALLRRYAERTLRKKDPYDHYPAPGFILDLWQHHDGEPRLAREGIHALVQNPVTHNLLRVYRLQEKLKALSRCHSGDEPRPIERVHVVGAGVMGGDIAAWAALKGFKVSLHDTSIQQLAKAMHRAQALFAKRLRDTRLVTAAVDRLVPDPHNHGVRHADLVIEAIVENAQAKIDLYTQLESCMQPDALLATNTSSLTLQQLNTTLLRPERFLGLHFFNPVARMPLVEVVACASTGSAQYQTGVRFADQLGKLPLPVCSTPGFFVNAVLAPYILAAMRCVDQGHSVADIDASMRQFGMPMGPLELADTVGLDVIRAAGPQLSQGPSLPSCLEQRLALKQLGRKSGQGFYRWKAGKAQPPEGKPKPSPHLVKQMLEPLLQATERCLQQGVVSDADFADAGMIFGAGFAPYTGGPLHYKNSLAPSQ
jgi:3-hydroxyacyl-CoA dehydrogenase/enoyl-CoA hydratase/3-hydroxybutyryl-CoA epimerase